MCHNIVPLFPHNHPNRENEVTRTNPGCSETYFRSK